MEDGKTERIVIAHATEIEEIKQKYPEITKTIESFREEFQKILRDIRVEIQNNIDSKLDQELAKVVLINAIHRTTDQIFL